MLKKHYFFMVLGCSICLLGCQSQTQDQTGDDLGLSEESPSAPSGRIGTINIAKIYNIMGLQQQRAAKQRELGNKLKEVSDQHKGNIEAKLTEFGGDADKLTDEQKKELQQLNAEHAKAVQQAQVELRRQMDETNQYLNNVFMQQTREPIRKVAEARGLDAVMVLQPNLFAYIKPTTDITDDVIKEIGIPLWKPEDAAKSPPTEGGGATDDAITPPVDPTDDAATKEPMADLTTEPSEQAPEIQPENPPVEGKTDGSPPATPSDAANEDDSQTTDKSDKKSE
jgi:Skp family chaperone for outer membrane proteins